MSMVTEQSAKLDQLSLNNNNYKTLLNKVDPLGSADTQTNENLQEKKLSLNMEFLAINESMLKH